MQLIINPDEERTLDRSRRAAVERVLRAMRIEVDGRLSLDDLAEIACLSPFHFTRVFRGVTGIPPGRFQTALKIDRAKALLLATDQPVTEICYAVGYESLGTFTTRFTSLVGVSPGRLRRLPHEFSSSDGSGARFEEHELRGPVLPGEIRGRVVAQEPRGLTFIGLFPEGIAQSMPVAGVVLPEPGIFRLQGVPDQRYHLLVAALPIGADLHQSLLPGTDLRVGHAPQPITVQRGRSCEPTTILLRPPLPTEPPVVVALAAELLVSAARSSQSRHGAA